MDLETELQQQLDEQQEALAGVQQLVQEAGSLDAELADLLADLQAGIASTEDALLGLKRQRLLAELDTLHSGKTGEQAQQQQQQQHHPGEDGGANGGGQGGAADLLPPSSTCIFRHTDGRHYLGRVLPGSNASGSGSGTARVRFLHPTRQYQLEPLELPLAALHPAPGGTPPVDLAQLLPGLKVIIKPRGSLWVPAEVLDADVAGQQVAAITLADKRRHVLPLTAVVLRAHVPSPHDCGDSSDEGGSGSSRGCGAFISDGGSSSRDEGEDSGGSGSDEEQEEGEEEGEEGGSLWGMVQQQAAAGAQTETNLFFESEAHSRGIGSKLLAGMGFRGQGHGLGRQQQGMQQALQATRLKRGAGLGVDGGSGIREGKAKRKRSGKQRRRDKATQAGLEQRQAKRQAQQELERQTGSQGLFAVLNSIIGDSSGAQAVRSRMAGGTAGGQADSKPRHSLFGGSAATGGAGPGSSSGGGKAAIQHKEEDRRQLSQRADELAQLGVKVQRLRDMAARNAKDRLMLPQIRRALVEAQEQLAAAQQRHGASSKAIQDREKLKRMSKF
ncbi:hypothetical protein D9Q98_001883 [Chlorella vulgaris]|uniref:G-patch domain-containing protein n=1 Tax=Chlorella vulgaris TaxID=3077 RepID=A0A9D4Z051_CHLVU|nr:hypothetical protein D9Q98_001883 [Chlorella vulgaris]